MKARRRVCGRGVLAAAVATLLAVTPAAASGAGAGGGGSGAVTVTRGTDMAVTVSPDGRTIVMCLQGVLWTLPAGGGTATRITDNLDDPAFPDWSPDGRRIAFQSYMGGNYHIWTMRPDGSGLRQLTFGRYDDREPRYSPDGTRIAFSSDRGGSYDVWVLDLRDGGLSRWTRSPVEEFAPTWSPDGTEVAFVVGREIPDPELAMGGEVELDARRIQSVDAAGDRRTLVTESEGQILAPSWAPDGERIAYTLSQDTESHLMVSGRRVTHGEDVFPFPAQWLSPDSLVYTADGRILRRDLGEDASRDVPFRARLSFDRPPYRFKDHGFDSRAAQPVRGVVSPALSPDGDSVAFVALNDLWAMPVGGQPRRLTRDPYVEAGPAWSPDGRYLAYSSDKAGTEDIWLRDLRTGRERRLTSSSGAEVAAAWSPDGDTIAFQDQEGATYAVDVASGAVRRVLVPVWEPAPPTWGPGGDTLALAANVPYSDRFREGTSQILTLDVGTGSHRFVQPLPFKSLSNRVSSGPVWSPDGRRMAFVIESRLWVMPVDSGGQPIGRPRRVTDEVAESPSWSGDSRHLLYLSNGALRLTSASGGAPRTVPLPLQWRPDVPTGRLVIHAGRLWDGQSRRLRRDVDVTLRANRIVGVGPHSDDAHDGVRVVDASNLTVMPGLWDAHVHQELYRNFLGARQSRQLLAFGITDTVSMGDTAYEAVEDRESLASGARVGPRFFASGEPIDGSRIYYNFMRPTTSAASFGRELSRPRALGYDIFKTYVRLPYDRQARGIAAAHRMGIPALSHYLYPPVAFGQDGQSHITATQRLEISRSQTGGGHAYSDVIRLAAASGMSLSSTLFDSFTLLALDPGLRSDPRVRGLYTPWQRDILAEEYAEATTTDQSDTRTALRRDVAVLRRVLRSGGGVMAGTDIPLVDVGVSLHLNLRAMVRYGMTPYEALRTATAIPAEQIGVGDDLGTVEPGKLADLVVVGGNPLRDIDDAADVRMLTTNGRLRTIPQLLRPFGDG
ncbi:amidohydrolase family protein [soil metagenome]